MSVWRGFLEGNLSQTLEESAQVLGEGSFGKVYLYNGFAVKVLKYSSDELLTRDTTKELIMFRALRGVPNVSQLREAWYDENHLYLVMDYQPRALSDMITKTHFYETKKHFSQMATGLHAMHERGILHSDIKPENILLTANYDCVYSDFGLSSVVACNLIQEPIRGGGTPVFEAPEQLARGTISRATDVYSLGITLVCYLLRVAYLGLDALDLLALVNGERKERVQRLVYSGRAGTLRSVTLEFLWRKFAQRGLPLNYGQVSAELVRDVDRMLDVDPQKRPSMAELRWIRLGQTGQGLAAAPPRADFARCYEGSTTAQAATMVRDIVLSVGKAADPALAFALTMDLAGRASQRCEVWPSELFWFLLLCFFIVLKVHQSLFLPLDEYWKTCRNMERYYPQYFSPVEVERQIFQELDFAAFSCADDELRTAFSGITLQEALNHYVPADAAPALAPYYALENRMVDQGEPLELDFWQGNRTSSNPFALREERVGSRRMSSFYRL